jgi:DNA-directed RNA polymerase subunit M/transcription elongation factor TFIIS
MVPKNSGKRTILVCRSCGREVKRFSANKYKITEEARSDHRDILVVEGERRRASEEERRYMTDLYGNEMYEMTED